jgi:hypothetical protein
MPFPISLSGQVCLNDTDMYIQKRATCQVVVIRPFSFQPKPHHKKDMGICSTMGVMFQEDP